MSAAAAASDGPTASAAPVAVRLWLVVFAAALTLYVATADRDVGWSDSGWHQVRIVSGELVHPRGLALTHPLHFFLGRAALWLPGLEPAFAITLVSCVAGAVAAANVAAVVALLTRRVLAALVAAAALALSHTFWQHATHTETYALAAALLSGEWLCLAAFATSGRPRSLVWAALLNGLGLSNHMLASLSTPFTVGVVLWAVLRGRAPRWTLPAAAAAWLGGAALYLSLIAATAVATGDLGGALRSALFGTYAREVLNTSLGLRGLGLSLGFVAYNLPGLTIPLALYAALANRIAPRWLMRVWLGELVVYTLFVVRYAIVDQYTFFFPVYMLLTVLAGVGLAQALASWRRPAAAAVALLAALSALWTPPVYAGAAQFMRVRGHLASLMGNKPYRDGYAEFLTPWGQPGFTAALNRQVFELAEGRGLILVEDDMIVYGPLYERALGRVEPRVEIALLVEYLADAGGGGPRARLLQALREHRPVVGVPRDRDRFDAKIDGARWARRGDVYVLESIE